MVVLVVEEWEYTVKVLVVLILQLTIAMVNPCQVVKEDRVEIMAQVELYLLLVEDIVV